MPAVAVASEESEVDIEVEEMQLESSEADEEDEEDKEEEAGEDELEESDGERESVTGPTRAGGPLKIKLKLGAQPESSSKAPSGRRFAHRAAKNEDVESEDSDSNSNSEDDSPNLKSYGAAPGRQLTARQAALASAGDTEHVSLDTQPPASTKNPAHKTKSAKSASEVALRKEENARKRKNMIEKKLEDEKAETINRLLKKQSRPKKQRTTAQAQVQVQSDGGEEGEEDGGGEDAAGGAGAQQNYGQKPMFRWVSSARRAGAVAADDEKGKAKGADGMDVDLDLDQRITFSVPESFLLPQSSPAHTKTEEDAKPVSAMTPTPARCAVDGCGGARKYRAVGKAWGVGACGLGHLRVLEGRV
ncbi:hypothetical protein C8F04DRAFT_1047916 [Mycena alexandri]|uniref:INO80 complex subunit B-like conserved region domain-containing protein n=1 Tax=Mycena alexandri TaxID=1745969 RepID=A0AAD6SC71_9AGAR|nr:hypothetical protein C8F04DRAFT_1047916 [Mycena alexandri]